MDQFITLVKKQSKLIAFIALAVAAFCTLLGYVGTFPGDFMPVMGHLLMMLFTLALILAPVVFLLLKKESVAKYAFFAFFAYWIISTAFNLLSAADGLVGGNSGIGIAVSLFAFLIGLAIAGAIVLFVLEKVLQRPELKKIALLILIFSLCAYLITSILMIAAYAQYQAGWTAYFELLSTYLALPVGMVFGYLYFSADGEPNAGADEVAVAKAPVEEKAEAVAKEDAEEVAEEAVTDDTPQE